jgi:hypothetical protein
MPNPYQLAYDPRAMLLENGLYDIDLMAGVKIEGFYCVIERVYRPPQYVITPDEAKFTVLIQKVSTEVAVEDEHAPDELVNSNPNLNLQRFPISKTNPDLQP